MIYHKYKNQRTEIDGVKFSSKKEAKYYQELLLARTSGELIFFLRQVPLHLADDVRYVVDFLEFWRDGSVRFVDVKGFKTDMYKVKKKLAEATYPIEIIEA